MEMELDTELATYQKSLNSNNEQIYKNNFKKTLILFIIISLIIILIIIIFLIIILRSDDTNEEENNNSNKSEEINYGIGQIICSYKIEQISSKTKILGDEYKNEEKINILFENKIIDFVKEMEFKNIGNHEITFIIKKDNLNMDNMFKNVSSLVSVKIISDKNVNISSMISVFETCQKLVNISIMGLDTSKVKSMKKLFYKSSLNNSNFTNINTENVKDMSYMFSSTLFTELDLSSFNTENVEDLSFMFSNCSRLK